MSQQHVHPLCPLVCLLTLSAAIAQGEDGETPTIRVSGRAEVRVVPDQVTLRFGIESRAKRLSDAASENDAKIAKVTKFLRSAEISDRDIRTESLRIKPIYPRVAKRPAKQQSADPFAPDLPPAQDEAEDAALTPTAFTVQRQLVITLGRLDQFEQVYRGLIERGVSEVDSIRFSTTKLREHRDDARINAIRAAKDKAEALAGELGAELAGVQSITESRSGGPGSSQNPFEDPFGGPADGDDRIAAGEIEVTAAVHVVFRLRATEFE